ncbi:esterase family protein [Colletotrichum plurivorum]|uniref:Esterase family protein n=1 Tax=Colletotrichum plurivorum TaxID=2175906 RepID=A0A8H6JMT3_9PEZI|nr:esterase family protein [Colletotrichum plurivorum]
MVVIVCTWRLLRALLFQNLRKKHDFEEIIPERNCRIADVLSNKAKDLRMNGKTKIVELCEPFFFTPNGGFKTDNTATTLGNCDHNLMNTRGMTHTS